MATTTLDSIEIPIEYRNKFTEGSFVMWDTYTAGTVITFNRIDYPILVATLVTHQIADKKAKCWACPVVLWLGGKEITGKTGKLGETGGVITDNKKIDAVRLIISEYLGSTKIPKLYTKDSNLVSKIESEYQFEAFAVKREVITDADRILIHLFYTWSLAPGPIAEVKLVKVKPEDVNDKEYYPKLSIITHKDDNIDDGDKITFIRC